MDCNEPLSSNSFLLYKLIVISPYLRIAKKTFRLRGVFISPALMKKYCVARSDFRSGYIWLDLARYGCHIWFDIARSDWHEKSRSD